MEFLFSVNVYVFIPMVLFLYLKIVKNYKKWEYRGMGGVFFPWNLSWPKEQQNTLLSKGNRHAKNVTFNIHILLMLVTHIKQTMNKPVVPRLSNNIIVV